MSPAEDAAQQALEKLLKARLVLADRQPSRTHELALLADQLGEPLPEQLLELQVFAGEARYEEGPFALKTPREELLAEPEQRLAGLEESLKR